MTVRKFIQPSNGSKTYDQAGFEQYCGEIEAAISVEERLLGMFAPYASTPPDMKVNVDDGAFSVGLGMASNVLPPHIFTQSVLPASANWSSVTYGNGIFVAVAATSSIAATSPDGITWTQRTLPASTAWYSVTYGNGIFVAVAAGGTIAATSPDGITWTQRTLPAASWTAVTYGNGVFVATAGRGATSSIAATSPDGITWTQRVLPAVAYWYSVTYANGVFVATAGGGTSIAATSPDGITWTQRVLPASANWSSVTYANGVFVAVVFGSSIAATSPDGITWTQRVLPASANWSSVTYANGIFVAVANGSAIAATSPDGITWTLRALPAVAYWSSVTYGNGIFVAVAGYGLGSTVAASGDASTIQASTNSATAEAFCSLQATSAFAAPTINPRIDRVAIGVLDSILRVITGTEAASPIPPAYPDGYLPVCQIALAPGQTSITNFHLTDERGLINLYSPAGSAGGDASAFGDCVGYELFGTPGTYNFVKPVQAYFYRITAVGGHGTVGGGAALPNLDWAAENLTVVVGANGASSTASSITGVTSGIAVSLAPGTASVGGAVSAAPFGAGITFAGDAVGSGNSGELGQLGAVNSFVLIEWF